MADREVPTQRAGTVLRALWKKEWRQLRGLRWTGFALGVLLPLILIAAAEIGRRGWLPFARTSDYDLRTLLLGILPAAFLVVWGLLAALIAAQSFAGDRAEGTEAFLLERPVRRSSIWWTRCAAAFVATGLLVAAHALYWWGLSRLLLPAAPETLWNQATKLLVLGTPLVVLASLCATLAAATFVKSPMHGVLLGLVLAFVPAGVASVLSTLFPLALWRDLPVGLFVPGLLLVAYAACSFFMACRGEPAGRGRLARGLIVLAAGLTAVPLVFAATAPVAMRSDAGRLANGARVVPGKTGGIAVGLSGHMQSGWLLDVERGRRLRFLPPPVSDVVFSPDGSRFAVLTSSTTLGGFANPRAEIFDADGSRLRTIPASPEARHLQLVGRTAWVGEHLVVQVWDTYRQPRFLVAHTGSGEKRIVDLGLNDRIWHLVGPTDAGELFVFHVPAESAAGAALLQRFDPVRGALDPEPVLEEPMRLDLTDDPSGRHYAFRHGISPGGRYLTRMGTPWLVDLTTGADVARDSDRRNRPEWLRDDLMIETRLDADGTRLVKARPGEPAAELRRWPVDRFVSIEPSPDRARLLVRVRRLAGAGDDSAVKWFDAVRGKLDLEPDLEELWVLDTTNGRWVDGLPSLGSLPRVADVGWAGPGRLALTGPGYLALTGIDAGSEPTLVIGEP